MFQYWRVQAMGRRSKQSLEKYVSWSPDMSTETDSCLVGKFLVPEAKNRTQVYGKCDAKNLRKVAILKHESF